MNVTCAVLLVSTNPQNHARRCPGRSTSGRCYHTLSCGACPAPAGAGMLSASRAPRTFCFLCEPDVAYGGIGLLALRQATYPGRSPNSNGLWASIMKQTSRVSLGWLWPPWVQHSPERTVADAVPLLTQAMEQATAMEIVEDQARCRLSLGESHMLAGHLEEAHALSSGRWYSPVSIRNAATKRMPCAFSARLRRESPDVAQAETYYQQALALAEELGMRPLRAHCHHRPRRPGSQDWPPGARPG